ncbi:hypothetical protein CMV03_06925 [Elizabethkingia anophelis]|nr:hypothetical protein [Elizabethkingia anophelis]
MGEIVIKKKNTTIDLFNYKPFRSVTKAELSRTLMSDDYVDISVECANTLDLNIGDRVTVEGRTFFLNMLPPAKKIAEDQFSYELRFEGPAFLLRKLKVFNLDSQGNKTTNEFPLTGEINEFLYLLINNANKKDNQWILGNVPSNTETKTLTFNNENCLAVLQRICQEFNVEFDIVEAGGKFTLNIREKIGKTLPFTVEYGMGNGLYDLSRARANDSEVVTVLYAYGSSQNIPVDYRGYSPRLRMPVAVGDYISNQAAIDLFGYVEDVFTPDIKPTFKGKVSGIGSLANGVQEISVSNMDFDLKEKESDGKTTKYLIAGTPAKISVTKGNLAGYDFEINDYDHSSKTFKLKQFADDRGQKFPDNTTVFKFAAGDEFTLIDIIMPEQYIINAEQKLYDETVKEYQKVSQNNVKYTLNVDPLFLQDKGEIGIGDLLPIKDADFGIDKASRIISLKKDLLTDTYTSFDVADSYEISLVKEIVNNIKDLQKEIASQKVINRQSYLDGYRRVEDRFSMYFDADGKMDGSHIKADTIDVGMLSSGSKSRWFQLEEVVFTPNLGSDPNSFRATAGRLVHFGIKTSSGAERIWNLSALTVNNLLNQGYYVYAKCDINGDYGTFIITPDRIVFDSQPNYYHFLIGNLYTAASGGRAFDANYGVSQMNGRMIFAGVISDIQGRPMIDLDKREIIGKVTFTNDSPALNQVQEKIDAVQVGSVNLLDNSAVFAMSANDVGLGTSVLIENESEKFYRATPDNGKRVSLYGIWYTLESNQEYVRGIYVRHSASVAQDVRVFNHNSNVGGEKITTIQPNTWTFIKTNTIIGSGGNTVLILEMFTPNISLDYKKTILVKGNRLVNDWTPSANDINNEITVAKQNATNAQNTANTAAQNAIDARNKALAASYASGNCLNRDVDFRNGLNGIQVYNNAGNGNVSLVHWIGGAPASQAPTKSTNVLAVEYNGQGADPYNGGFYFGTQTRANAVFVVRIIMKLATGQEISFHSNQAGDSFTFDWTTPIKGTGKWEEYIGILRCGATGAFSSSMFFAFFGASVPLSTYICYASVFDLTDVDRYLEDRIKQNEQQTALAKAQADNALATSNITSQKVSFLSTTINNNVVSTGTLEVGDVVGANAGITGVTDRGRQSVRMYAGAPYANKNTAPFTLQDDGLIKMHHPNGNKGFELGIVDGKLVFNVYDDVGNKIMEMGSAGIVFANYIPDSWSTFYLGKFNSSSYNPYNLNEVSSFANGNTKQEMINSPGNIDDPEQWIVTIPKSDSEWVNYSQYSAGTSYDSNTYKKYEGIYYKGTLQKPQKPNDYTEKLADGWYYYTVSTHVWKQRGNPNMNGRYEYAFTLFRLSQGQLVETLNYELSGIV